MAEYISKQAAVDAGYLSDWYISSVGDEPPAWTDAHIDELLNDFIVIPKGTSTADVQPVKHGRWVQYNRNGEETYIECTNCCVPSRPRHLQMVTRSGEGLPDYCPNCGTRMDLNDGDTECQ